MVLANIEGGNKSQIKLQKCFMVPFYKHRRKSALQNFSSTCSQQLSIVSHARLLLSMISCSNRDFFTFRSSKNWRNRLPRLLGRSWPHVESPTVLTSDVRQGLEDSAISFGREGKVVNMCSRSSMNSFFTAVFLISPELACLNNFCDLRKGDFH